MAQAQEVVTREEARQEVAAPDAATAFIQMVERAASNPDVDVDKLERLLAMQERVIAREARMAYMGALAKLELPVIEKRGRIDLGKGKPQPYAKWEDINEAIKPILKAGGFTLSFRTGITEENRITVTGILAHEGGHQEETTITLPHDSSGSKNPVQAVGSSTSYGKRYTAAALLNLTFADEDDDGKAAGIGEPITDEQVKVLQAAIVETGADLPKFLAYFKIEKLEDLPAAKFETAKKMLMQRAAGKPAS